MIHPITCFLGLRRYLLLMLVSSVACSSVPTTSLPSAPFFVADPGDNERYQALVQRQQKMFPNCEEPGACAHGHFIRALVSLYENRETAAKHFERVMEVAPNSRLASTSRIWIRLIEDQRPTVPGNPLLDILRFGGRNDELLTWSTEQLVRDLLEREMIILQLLRQKQRDAKSLREVRRELGERGKELDRVAGERDSMKARMAKPGQPSFKKLRKELAVRDKKIKELSNQLDALKRIDQEMRKIVK